MGIRFVLEPQQALVVNCSDRVRLLWATNVARIVWYELSLGKAQEIIYPLFASELAVLKHASAQNG